MEAWQTIVLASGSQALLLAVLGWLGKSFINKLIIRDTEQFKSDLKAESDSAIEHLRNELQLRTTEHQIRFSRLHEKRASVIADLYGHLVEALWEAESFLSPMEWSGEPTKQEKYSVARNKLVELYRFFDKHRIYLPEEQCQALESLIQEVRRYVIQSASYINYNDLTIPEHLREKKYEIQEAGYDAIKNKIPRARESLENAFRSLLGAESRP